MSDIFNRLMHGVGERLSLGEIEIQHGVSALIGLDEILVCVQYLEKPDQILLYTDVATLPADGCEALYAALLEGQSFFHQTAGATLAISKEAGMVLLQIALPMRILDVESLMQSLENFVQVTAHWRARCANIIEEKAPAPDSQDFVFGTGLGMLRV